VRGFFATSESIHIQTNILHIMGKVSEIFPLVSVIIPLYNKGPYVKRALESILSQNIQNIEIIIIDGGSTDNSLEVVRSFRDPRIFLITQTGKGVSSARNEGVKIAKSNFIAFLDADDEWMPNFIETVLRLHDSYQDAGFYQTAVKEKFLDPNKILNHYSFIPFRPWEGLVEKYFKAILNGDPLFYPSSLAISKKKFLEYGGFYEKASWGEDQDLCARIALENSVAFSSNICTIIHKTEDVSSAMLKRITNTEEHPFIRSGLEAIRAGKIPESMITDLRGWIIELILFSAKNNLFIGNQAAVKRLIQNYGDEINLKQRVWLKFWCFIPLQIYKNGGHNLFVVFYYSLQKLKNSAKMK
jgi:glycosyltransferase involved in cell wall biosynthesis